MNAIIDFLSSMRYRFRHGMTITGFATLTMTMPGVFFPASIFAADSITVYTVNYPLKYFAERIAGSYATVSLPVPAAVDPAGWVPDIETVLAYQKADMILLNGASFARWVTKASLPLNRIVNTTLAIEDQLIPVKGTQVHIHGPSGTQEKNLFVSRTWLDLSIASFQARAVMQALVDRLPEHAPELQKNFQDLESELLDLDRKITAAVGRNPDRMLLAFGSGFPYLERRYKVKFEAVITDFTVTAGDRDWNTIERALTSRTARWTLWDRQLPERLISRLRVSGFRSQVFNAVANTPASGDFMSVMQANIRALQKIYQ